MAKKIHIQLDKRRPLKDGTFPIKISFYLTGRGSLVISSGLAVKEENFHDGVVLGIPQKTIYNSLLRHQCNAIDEELISLNISGRLNILSVAEIKERCIKKIQNVKINTRKTFEDIANDFIETKTKTRTKEIYEFTVREIGQYTNLKTLFMEDINVSWLKTYEMFLLEKMKVNSISIIMRNIRTIFNYAIDNELVSADAYPFRKFKIKTEATPKRSLTLEQLRYIRDLKIESPSQEKCRDIFMLMFYLIGINVIDLLNCGKPFAGRIEYKRAKTGRLYSIKVEPEAQEIIDKYAGNKLLLDILEKNERPYTFLFYLDKTLHRIYKPLTSYWCRHTWATFCSELDIPKETIAAGLGHGGNSVTDIYIDFNQKKVDAANRKVIDYLNADKKSEDK